MLENNPQPKDLLSDLIVIIEGGQKQAAAQVNSTLTLVFWQVGKRINEDILGAERAAYGKQVVKGIAEQLTQRYGRSFQLRNIRRMIQFATVFDDLEIVTTLSSQLSWSHFVELFRLKSEAARHFYAQRIREENWSIRHTRRQIERKAYERRTIADSQFPTTDTGQLSIFKDPYFLDFLGLHDSYSEEDLEAAILREIEQFILELGNGFTFVERQKRIILDGKDFYLDLLFFHRKLRRLVATELKFGEFKPAHKGQMELYLKWLNRYDRQDGENSPIGLILCAVANDEQVELLEMHKDGIMVAEYWTELPPKAELEKRLRQALVQARERIARRKLDK
ncbi:MAG: PDDEXK nuclease domain-containing protein [Bacteroidota bacterium]